MNPPLVHVLVINWNGIEHLEECFRSLLSSTCANVKFVLVDNASSDHSVAFVQENFASDDRVEILELSGNLGWSGGNNVGMECALDAGADYILLINNDTSIAPDAIEHMVALAESDPLIGAVAPKLLMFDSPALINSIGLEATDIGTAWDMGIGRLDGDKWAGNFPVVGVCGAGFLLRAEILRKTGLLPTDFEIYLDDLDLSLRIWNAGSKILTCPEAAIRHKFSSTMGEGKRARHKYYLNTRNRMRLIQRNYPLSKLPTVLRHYALAECRAVMRALLDGELWRVVAHKRAWLDAILYIPKARRARRELAKAGLSNCQFWDFIQTDKQFFPGVELPDHGWYAPENCEGKEVRPISSEARYEHLGGRLDISQVNPYPHINSLAIDIMQDSEVVSSLHGREPRSTTLDLPPGEVIFRANTIFSAEETGRAYDAGGWLAVTQK